MKKIIGLMLTVIYFAGCQQSSDVSKVYPLLQVSENNRYLKFDDEIPFLWIGSTSWGMSEWLTREKINIYLDDRREKGINVIQICAFWGKRHDDPVKFTTNPPNAYGHKAFVEIDSVPDPTRPLIKKGGSHEDPNDYWDHFDYIIKAAAEREMMVALLPVWGRRYVNATHKPYSMPIFNQSGMLEYGRFLGRRYKEENHIIWVMGGDVKAANGGDFRPHYRKMAEGIIWGITGQQVKWNEPSPLWDRALMTYHPDGAPMINSSTWFHNDIWLDFNMIETFQHRDSVYASVAQDYGLTPVKPTVMAEPAYEGITKGFGPTLGIHVRRQAWQTFLAGGVGFTYGASRDKEGNGPLYSPFKGWQNILDMEGVQSLKHINTFCKTHDWPFWTPNQSVIIDNIKGQHTAVAAINRAGELMVYFPTPTTVILDLERFVDKEGITLKWFNTKEGQFLEGEQRASVKSQYSFSLPVGWEDGILVVM